MQDGRAVLAVPPLGTAPRQSGRRLNVGSCPTPCSRGSRPRSATGTGRRRLVGDVVPEGPGQQRGEADPRGLHSVTRSTAGSPAVGNGALIWPQAHRPRSRRRALRQDDLRLDPLLQRQPGRRRRRQRPAADLRSAVMPKLRQHSPHLGLDRHLVVRRQVRQPRPDPAREKAARGPASRIQDHSRSTASASNRDPR